MILGIVIAAIFLISQYGGNVGLPGLQATLNPTDYVEWQCEDVSQYYADGYTDSSVDENGCQIVQKYTYLAYECTELGASSDPVSTCQGYCSSIGKSYAGNFCSSNTYSCACQIQTVDYKGGFIQVVNTCTFENNDLLVVESFGGGQSIHRTGVGSDVAPRYPVKSFCKANPAIIINSDTQESVTSTVLYDRLWDGELLDIPSNEQWTIFYIIENNFQLPTICEGTEGQALNTETNTCVASTGIVYACSQGQFDPSLGVCVVQPESTLLCDQGRLELLDDGTSRCVYNPPLQVDCSVYGTEAYYSVNQDKCIVEPDSEKVCTVGEYDAEADLCFVEAGTDFTCPDGGTYNAFTDRCEEDAETVFICENGVLQLNEITGNRECIVSVEESQVVTFTCDGELIDGTCYSDAPEFVESPCPSNTTWNAEASECIETPVIVTPSVNKFIKESKPDYISLGYWILLVIGGVILIILILTKKKK